MQVMSLPEITVTDYPETHVGYVIPLAQTALVNKTLYDIMKTKDSDFAKIYAKMSREDWEILAEIEGILRPIFVQSTSTAQENNACNNSLNPFYRLKVMRILNQSEFKIMDIDHRCCLSNNVKNWPRKTVRKSSLGPGGQVCAWCLLLLLLH